MLAIRAPGSRVQRHFSPLTTRSVFKQERLSTPPQIAYHITYTAGAHNPRSDIVDPLAVVKVTFKAPPIKKPDGEVTRINRGGYNLQAELKWTDEFYATCQVRLFYIIYLFLNNMLPQKSLSRIAEGLLDVSKTWPEQTAAKKKEYLKAVSTVIAQAISLC